MNKQYIATFILPTEGRDIVVDEGIRLKRSDGSIDWISVHPHTSPGPDAIPEGTEVLVSDRGENSSEKDPDRVTVESAEEVDIGYLGVVYDQFHVTQ